MQTKQAREYIEIHVHKEHAQIYPRLKPLSLCSNRDKPGLSENRKYSENTYCLTDLSYASIYLALLVCEDTSTLYCGIKINLIFGYLYNIAVALKMLL